MISLDLRKIFVNLQAGDEVVIPGSGRLLVLKADHTGSKHFGTICGCGQHVNGIPFTFTWSDALGMPTNALFKKVLWWQDGVTVEKAAKVALAERFASLMTEDEVLELTTSVDIHDPRVDEALTILGHSHTSSTTAEIVAALRATGAVISDEQAGAVIAASNLVALNNPEVAVFSFYMS